MKNLSSTSSSPARPPGLPTLRQFRAEWARRHLLPFTTYTFPRYKADPVHELVAGTLERVQAGEITKLMIFAPPQHGKSELTSVRLPAWWLGRRPEDPVILASYAALLAERNSRYARQIVESGEYDEIFPGISTRRDSRAVNRWELQPPRRGSLLAVGVGGPITGHGARLGVIDDPFENWEQAQSLTIRDSVWDWYRTTFRTRIWEGGAMVLIMTRWHEDDLAGRILLDQAKEWTVLRLPALAETQDERDANCKRLGLAEGQPDPLGRAPGEPLSPSRFSREALLELQKDVGELAWAGEYQGVPRAPGGNLFKREWFADILRALPAECTFVRYWDKAGTAEAGAFTAGVLMAKAPTKLFIVVDVVRGQWSATEREAIIRQTAFLDVQRYGPGVVVWQEQEPGSGGKESAESTVKNLAGFTVYTDRVTGSKDVRLQPLVSQAGAGNVKLLDGPWNGAYIEEMTSVPNGKYRDQADGSAGAFNKLTLDTYKKPGTVRYA